ncbi:MAG: hypothetical protein ACP5SF_02930 [Thermoplasmata archaeon]
MDWLTLENNIISEGDRIIGTISIEKKSILIQGSVSITIKKEKNYYSLLEDNMPFGRIERNLKIVYQGKDYEPNKNNLYNFLNGSLNKLDIFSSGSLVGSIEREGGKLIVKSENTIEKTPFIVYLAVFSRYRLPAHGRRRGQALSSPYKEIYYVLLGLFFALFILMNIYNVNQELYSIILLVLIIAEFSVYFIGRRKIGK